MVFGQQHRLRGDYTGESARPRFGTHSALELSTISPAVATNNMVFDILLAKDNLAKQKLAVKILKKYGHSRDCREWVTCGGCI